MEGKFAHMSPSHTHCHIKSYDERPNFVQSSATELALKERERERVTNVYV